MWKLKLLLIVLLCNALACESSHTLPTVYTTDQLGAGDRIGIEIGRVMVTQERANE